MRFFHLSVAPPGTTPIQKKNFLNVQIDAIGIGLASAASRFLPVFLTRLGATNFQVGLLTAMPAFTGLFFAIAMGRFLQSRRNIVPWFSGTRLLAVSGYALTGIVSFIVPQQYIVPAVLVIWAAISLPQVTVNVAFSVVMNAVAGPRGRYSLLSRRWSIIGLISAIMVTVVGQILHRVSFPINYQLVFIGLSAGGLISYYYSMRIELPDAEPQPHTVGQSLLQRFEGYVNLIRSERAFLSFTSKRFVYTLGSALSIPLFPLYYVREAQATDAWIGIINTAQTFIMLIGYFFWARQGKVRGSRFVLLRTALGLAFYPALIASTHRVEWIALYTGLAGIFQAGLDLVFFDELMKTVPLEHSATFVSLAQTVQHLSAVAAPLLGTLLADLIGIGGALAVSTALCLVGFGLFAWSKESQPATQRKGFIHRPKRVKRASKS
jgi:hypothetical protein